MGRALKNESPELVLSCNNISRWFGGLQAVKNVNLEIRKGEILGLVGPNGSGKTTIVNAITGFFPPQEGQILYEGKAIHRLRPHQVAQLNIARTFQNVALFKGMTVLENILLGRHNFMRPSILGAMFYWWWAQNEEIQNRSSVESIIDLLQLEDVRDELVDVIPLGIQKRVELARALCAEPRFLILDEPMAGMNQEEKEYMVRFILDAKQSLGLTILLIEHHMDVVTAICDRLVVLNNGEKIKEGEPMLTISDPAVVAAYIGRVDHAPA